MAAEVVAVDLVAASIDGNVVGACNGPSSVEESALYLSITIYLLVLDPQDAAALA